VSTSGPAGRWVRVGAAGCGSARTAAVWWRAVGPFRHMISLRAWWPGRPVVAAYGHHPRRLVCFAPGARGPACWSPAGVLVDDVEREGFQLGDQRTQPAGVVEPGLVVALLAVGEPAGDGLTVDLAGPASEAAVQVWRVGGAAAGLPAAAVAAVQQAAWQREPEPGQLTRQTPWSTNHDPHTIRRVMHTAHNKHGKHDSTVHSGRSLPPQGPTSINQSGPDPLNWPRCNS
jgi:hypothetical protein